jgi:hypothetical protein
MTLTVTNAFAVLRLLPMNDRDKDAESSPCAIRQRSWSVNSVARSFDSHRAIARC